MSRITEAFAGKKAFIPFITGGDPDLATTGKLILAMAAAGADLIEIGVPFSDPVAEGPVIQGANERALANGCNSDLLFDLVREIRQKTPVPLLYMTYMNPVYAYGKERFLERCASCGLNGLIVPDLPYEEKDELTEVCQRWQVDLVSMIAPVSQERIALIAKEAEGFLYCVSSLGVTGVRDQINTDIGQMVRQVRAVSDIPCAIGFGIATPAQARQMAALADGVIVGSAIVELVARYGVNSVEPVAAFVGEMKREINKAAV